MIREEEIYKVAKEFSSEITEAYKYSYKDGFIDGCVWSDNHPKSPWISVNDDLPCNHEEFTRNSRMSTKLVLVRTRKATYFVNYMIKEKSKWKSKWKWFCPVDNIENEIEYWMPIPELPKE